MVLFAITNGFLGSVAMMIGPVDCEKHEKEKAGIIMVCFVDVINDTDVPSDLFLKHWHFGWS